MQTLRTPSASVGAAPISGVAASPAGLPEPTLATGPAGGGARFWLGLAALTLLAAAARLYKLGEFGFWIDELYLVNYCVDLARGEIHPRTPAYVLTTLWLWAEGIDVAELGRKSYATWRAAGIDEMTLRLPTTILAIVSVPILGWLTRRIVPWQVALLTTLLLAVAVWHVWMSQVARFYPQQILFYNAALILYLDARLRRSNLLLAVAVGCFVLAFTTQFTTMMLAPVFVFDWLYETVRGGLNRRKVVALSVLMTALGACAVVFLLAWDFSKFEGGVQNWKHIIAGTPFLVGVPVSIFAMCTGWWLLRSGQQRLGLYLLASLALPAATLIALNLLGSDVHVRYMVPTVYSWLLLGAIGGWAIYRELRPRTGPVLAWAPAAVLVATSLFGLFGYYTGGFGYRERWRDAFELVERRREAGELVAADYNPEVVGEYYVGEDVVLVNDRTRIAELAALGRPLWVVVQAESPTQRGRLAKLRGAMDLIAVFNSQILQPYSSVAVYRFDPASALAQGAIAAEGSE